MWLQKNMSGSSKLTTADETLDIVTADEKRLSRPSYLFYLWFASNLSVGDFFLGVVIEYYYALPFLDMIITLLLANIAGGILVGVMSYIGPVSGKGQMEVSKDFFGISGGKAFSLLQFVNTVGWLTVNLIISAGALGYILSAQDNLGVSIFGYNIIYLIAIFITFGSIYLTIRFGHKSIRRFEWAMSFFLGLLFIYMAIRIFTSGASVVFAQNETWNIYNFAAAFMLSFSYIMSWGPYASDYSRYIKNTGRNKTNSVIYTLAGSAMASFMVELISYMTAAYLSLNGSVSSGIYLDMFGYFWVIGAITFFLGGLAANSLNLYSNLMSARAIGIAFGKNFLIAAISIITIILSIMFFNTFTSYFEGFLFVLDYWITPWLGVMIAEFFIVKKKASIAKVNWSPILSYIIGIAASYPFMDTITIYFGVNVPLYAATNGVDISYAVSFALSLILTVIFEKFVFGRNITNSMAVGN